MPSKIHSLGGWLAAKQSALMFEEIVVPLYDDAWARRRQDDEFAPGGGKVPILWDGDIVVWDSLAIIEWLAEKSDPRRFWPEDPAARAMARSIAAEMHSSYAALRQECMMNLRRRLPTPSLSAAANADVERIEELWTTARDRFGAGGPYLFGGFGAADIMFAPVVTRFVTYSIPVSQPVADYMTTMLQHPFMEEWVEAASEEPWIIEKFEPGRL